MEDKPPVAMAGQDRVVQPREDVTLNGIESKDDKKIVKYEWTQVSGDSSAVMTVGFPEIMHSFCKFCVCVLFRCLKSLILCFC